MHLVFVTQVDLDAPHGGTRHVVGLTKALAAAGHRVELLACGGSDILGVTRLDGGDSRSPGTRREIDLAARLTKKILRDRPDLVYIRVSASTSLTAKACSLARVPYVVELNGSILEELAQRGRSPRAIKVVQASLRLVFSRAEHTVAMFYGIADHARQKLGARGVTVASHGVDLETAVVADRSAARRELDLPDDLPIISLVSTLGSELRLDLLAEAHQHMPGVRLVIAGHGERVAVVEDMVKSASSASPVHYLGSLPHPRAISLINASDVCVNVRTGFVGMKGLEYAALGRRQVGFDHPDLDRLKGLYPSGSGFIAVRESAKSLREGLQSALRQEAQEPLSVEAVEAARSQVGWNVKAAELDEVFKRVLK